VNRGVTGSACVKSGQLPLIGQPSRELADWRCGQAHQQLGEIQLRVHVVPAAVLVRLAKMAAVRPPRALPTNRQLLRLWKNFHNYVQFRIMRSAAASRERSGLFKGQNRIGSTDELSIIVVIFWGGSLSHRRALRTDNLGGSGGRRCWQVIDCPVTRPARFLKVVTRWYGDFRDPNDSKMTASTGYVQENGRNNVYRFSAAVYKLNAVSTGLVQHASC
jgi:hypothetical protein